QVAGDFAETTDLTAGVAQTSDGDTGPESRAVLAHPPAFILQAPLLGRNTQLVLGLALRDIFGRIEAREVLADDFGGFPTLESLGRTAPRYDGAFRVEHRDGTVGDVVDQELQKLPFGRNRAQLRSGDDRLLAVGHDLPSLTGQGF